jgi:hypothetical protein
MKTITKKNELKDKITFLKEKQTSDLMILKHQYKATINSFKPLNIIKSTTQEFILNPDVKSTLINGAISLGNNYLSQNLLNENSKNPLKRVLGKVLTFAIKNFFGKKS